MHRLARLFLPLALLVCAVGAGSAQALPPNASDTAVAQSHGPDPTSLYKPGIAAAAPYDVDAKAPWSASQWDGVQATTEQADLTSLPTVHAIYVYPADKPSRFAQYAAMFQADARQANTLLSSLYGRGVRFDERLGAGGASYLDITVFRSKYRANRLGGGSQFSMVEQELRASGKFSSANKKYAIWLDAKSAYCGQGELYQDTRRSSANNSNVRTTAIVYRPYDTANADGGFCRGRTLLHEVGHNLGAVQQVAPHAFDGAHCDDSAEDVMCYTSRTSFDPGPASFDYNNDDYFDASSGTKLGWWAVNLNRFVCPLTGCGNANPASPTEY